MNATARCLTAGLAAVAALALSACGSRDGDPAVEPEEGKPRATVQKGLVTYANPPAQAEIEPIILGVLRWDEGNACWYTESPLRPGGEPQEVTTVFAEGTTGEPGQAITFPEGEVARPGDKIMVGGGPHEVGDRAEFTAEMACGDRPLTWSRAIGPAGGAAAPEASAG